ncbi:MAG: hypothetical protein ABFD96_17955 [Armatimonadia bacterium]
MVDVNLAGLLRHEVWIERPEVRMVAGDVAVARGVRQEGLVRVLVRPLDARETAGLLGRLEEARYAVYMTAAEDVAEGDVLAQRVWVTRLAEAAAEGTRELRVEEALARPGEEIEVGGESGVLAGVVDEVVSLAEGLEERHEAGCEVVGVRRFEVLGVEDEGGQGHHWRVLVRPRVV